jgi:hypothetical protein
MITLFANSRFLFVQISFIFDGTIACWNRNIYLIKKNSHVRDSFPQATMHTRAQINTLLLSLDKILTFLVVHFRVVLRLKYQNLILNHQVNFSYKLFMNS